jgi:hypothetical protein
MHVLDLGGAQQPATRPDGAAGPQVGIPVCCAYRPCPAKRGEEALRSGGEPSQVRARTPEHGPLCRLTVGLVRH